MTAITQLIFRHWPLKLAALGLATVLYMGVAISDADQTQTWSGPVPIEVLNAPSGGAVLDDPGAVEAIEYTAPSEIADTITNDSFRASIDLSAVEPRQGGEPVEVPVDVFPVDPRVRVLDYDPPGVAVRVDEVVRMALPVEVDTGPLPEGIEIGRVGVVPALATVSGASSRVQNVRSLEGRVVVDASGINIDEDVAVEAFDELGVPVAGVDIDPATVRVTADVAYQLAYATVPVIPELTGEPARGRRVDNVSVLPATVTVSGENPDLNQLEFINTAPVDISGEAVELVAEVPLVLPPDTTSAGGELVTVLVTFTESLGSRSYQVGTALVGAQPGFSYQVAEPWVEVVISGPVRQLDELGVEGLSVEVPVSGLQVGDNEVMPIVRTPRGTGVVSLDPETVTVTVDEAP